MRGSITQLNIPKFYHNHERFAWYYSSYLIICPFLMVGFCDFSIRRSRRGISGIGSSLHGLQVKWRSSLRRSLSAPRHRTLSLRQQTSRTVPPVYERYSSVPWVSCNTLGFILPVQLFGHVDRRIQAWRNSWTEGKRSRRRSPICRIKLIL